MRTSVGEETDGGAGVIKELENSDWNLQNFQFSESKTPREEEEEMRDEYVRKPTLRVLLYYALRLSGKFHKNLIRRWNFYYFSKYCSSLRRSRLSLCNVKPILI